MASWLSELTEQTNRSDDELGVQSPREPGLG